jgi:hypothetical protein
MNGPTRLMAAALWRSAALMPADRREWAEAVWAEAGQVPAGRQRQSWLAGGLWLAARQAMLNGGRLSPLAFAFAVGGVAAAAWSGPSGDPAVVIDRVDVIAMAAILTALSWGARRVLGPVAGSTLARVARASGYTAILALVLAKSAVMRVAYAPPNNLAGPAVAWAGEAAFLAVMSCYATVILVSTARRSPATPATAAIGTVAGVAAGALAYALGPLGFPLRFAGPWPAGLYDAAMAMGVLLAACAPVAAGRAATRRAGGPPPPGSRLGQGALAGVCTGTAAALTVAVLSTSTIALLPYDAGLRDWAASHIGQWTPIAGHVTPVIGPRLGYVAGNSAFAAGYLIVLIISPRACSALSAAVARAPRGGVAGEALPSSQQAPRSGPVTPEEPT